MSRPPYIRKIFMSEKITELIILLIVIGMIVYTFLTFSKLPKTVPTHIGVTGQVDGYGNKGTLLAMPIIGLVFYIGLSVLQRFPNIFNFPIEVTENNAEALYSLGIKLIRCLKLFVVLIFAVESFTFTQLALGKEFTAGIAFLTFLIVLMIVMLIYYIVKMTRQRE